MTEVITEDKLGFFFFILFYKKVQKILSPWTNQTAGDSFFSRTSSKYSIQTRRSQLSQHFAVYVCSDIWVLLVCVFLALLPIASLCPSHTDIFSNTNGSSALPFRLLPNLLTHIAWIPNWPCICFVFWVGDLSISAAYSRKLLNCFYRFIQNIRLHLCFS